MIGYIIYWLLMIIPGIIWINFFKINNDSIIEKLALSFSVGISLFIFSLIIYHLIFNQIEFYHLYIGLLISILFLLFVMFRSKTRLKIHLEGYDWGVLLIYIGHLIFLSLHFVKFPIFPNALSADFKIHLKYSLSLINGTKTIKELWYYPAVELLLGSGIVLVDGEPLISMRHIMTLTAAFTPLVIYLVAVQFFGNKRMALLCCILYAFSSSFWYDSLYISGLYASILSSLLSLVAMSFLYISTNKPSRSSYLLTLIIGVVLFLSHSTSAIFIFVAWTFLIVIALIHRQLLRNYFIALVFLSSSALTIIFKPNLLSRIISALRGTYMIIESGDILFTFLRRFSPFLAHTSSYAGIILVVLSLTGFLIILIQNFLQRRFGWGTFFPLWYGTIWLLSLQGMNVWRFSLLSLTPSIFLVGYLVEAVIHEIELITLRLQGTSTSLIKLNRYGLSTLFVITIMISGGCITYISSTMTSRSNVERQTAIYESMLWIMDCTPVDAKFLVFSEWEFVFLDSITHRVSNIFSPYTRINAEIVLEMAKKEGATHLIVTNNLNTLFEDYPAVSECWRNQLVTIFKFEI